MFVRDNRKFCIRDLRSEEYSWCGRGIEMPRGGGGGFLLVRDERMKEEDTQDGFRGN